VDGSGGVLQQVFHFFAHLVLRLLDVHALLATGRESDHLLRRRRVCPVSEIVSRAVLHGVADNSHLAMGRLSAHHVHNA